MMEIFLQKKTLHIIHGIIFGPKWTKLLDYDSFIYLPSLGLLCITTFSDTYKYKIVLAKIAEKIGADSALTICS